MDVRPLPFWIVILVAWAGLSVPAWAQGDRYWALNQHIPPGMAGSWATSAGRNCPPWMQPVRIQLPSPGTVTFHDGAQQPISMPAPAQAAMLVGRFYRLRISDLPDYPGVSFYPSIELLDRLHPPTGRIDEFPVVCQFTDEEFEAAAAGRLVTKVVYLEQPQRVPLERLNEPNSIRNIAPHLNSIAEADLLGRPILLVRLGARQPDPRVPDPGFLGDGSPLQLTIDAPAALVAPPGAGTARLDGKIRQASFRTTTPSGAIIESCPPEPRTPLVGCDPWGIGRPCLDGTCDSLPQDSSDEYLCDGGDRDLPVHYGRFVREGLDTEDTVGEYRDHTGKERMKPSSRVCIYGPRFAQVRSISLPHEELGSDEVAGLEGMQRNGGFRNRTGLNQSQETRMLGGVRVRSRASGLESEAWTVANKQLRAQTAHEKILNLFQDLSFVQSGYLDQSDAARLQDGLKAAWTWSRDLSPVIAGKAESPVEGLVLVSSNVITIHDDAKAHKPGELRLVKLADKKTAQPGDIITFTIRYDNLGPREIHQVRVVDNLTPRLEYVDDSATSDRAGRLVTEDNGEGSLVLTWEFTDSLPPYVGGVVTFQARVR